MSQELSVEKMPTNVEEGFAIFASPMRVADEQEKKQRFAEYIQYWMDQNGLKNPKQVEQRSKKYSVSISDALVQRWLNGEQAGMTSKSIVGLANGLSRPPEEVFLASLGKVAPINTQEYKDSDFAHLWELCEDLPRAERNVYFRYVRMLAADVLRVIDSLKSE